MNQAKIEEGFRLVLEGLGLDTSHPHLRDSARRTAEAWHDELCAGLGEPALSLDVVPVEEGYQSGMVALQDIPVKSVCAHHLLPFVGRAIVAYIPDGYICGLSKLSRIVNHFARQPQVQEELNQEIAHFMAEHLKPRGVGVVIQATHSCMELRGVNHSGLMTTSTLLGAFREDPDVRAEFMALVNAQSR